MDGREDIKDLAGEVIDTERSTSRRNSIVQSERCGAHAEAMSKASRSGTRFLPTDINQLSRVTNERRVGTKPFHGPPYVHTRTRRTHENGEHPNDASRHLLHLRECRISNLVLSRQAVSKSAPARFYKRYAIIKLQWRKRKERRKLYDVVYGDPCNLFEKHTSADGSIMHNHVARRKV